MSWKHLYPTNGHSEHDMRSNSSKQNFLPEPTRIMEPHYPCKLRQLGLNGGEEHLYLVHIFKALETGGS